MLPTRRPAGEPWAPGLPLPAAGGAFWAGLLLASLSRPALGFPLDPIAGEPARLDSTWTVHLHLHQDNENARDDDDDYGDLETSYDLHGGWAHHSLALRFDALHFIDPPTGQVIEDNGAAEYHDEYVLEKLTWSWSRSGLSLAAGDSYVNFGRGLGLSLRRIDELGEDTSLRGGLADYSSRYLHAQLVGGWSNVTDWDPVSERLRFASCSPGFSSCNPLGLDPADPVLGARAELRWPTVGHLGFQEVALQTGSADWTASHGVSLEVPTLSWHLGDLYLEGVKIDRPRGGDDGTGLYGALNLYLGPLNVLLEGKDYSHVQLVHQLGLEPDFASVRKFYYNEPAALEPFKDIPTDNDNTEGGRIRLSLPVAATGSVFEAAGALFRNGLAHEGSSSLPALGLGGGDDSRVDIVHVYVGDEQELPGGSKGMIHVGLRREEPVSEQGVAVQKRLVHTDGKLVVPVLGPHSLSLGWTLQWWRVKKSLGDPDSYEQGELRLGYSWAPHWDVTLVLGLDDQRSRGSNPTLLREAREQGLPPPDDPEDGPWMESLRTHFYALVATWYPADWLNLQGTFGSLRGGERCISGMCRIFPPFSGAKAEATLRF